MKQVIESECRLILMGFLVSRVLLSWITGMAIGPFFLLPGFAAAVVCLFLLPFVQPGSTAIKRAVCICAGMIADSFLFWNTRPGMESLHETASVWNSLPVFGAIIMLLVTMAIFAIAHKLPLQGFSWRYADATVNKIALFWMPILTIVLFRAVNLMTQDIPNEGRSLFIAGTEVHHSVQGVLFLLVLSSVACAMRGPSGVIFNILLGVTAGFILDQISYLTLLKVTDAAYNGQLSWVGATLGVVCFSFAALLRSGFRTSGKA